MGYVWLCCLRRCLLRRSRSAQAHHLVEELRFRVEHGRQASSYDGWICGIALVGDGLLNRGQHGTQARIPKLNRLELVWSELQLAFTRLVKELLDSCGCVAVSVFWSARPAVLHAFDASHALENPGENALCSCARLCTKLRKKEEIAGRGEVFALALRGDFGLLRVPRRVLVFACIPGPNLLDWLG